MTIAIQEMTRDQRVKHFLSLSHDQAQAENLADGLPEWSQRIVDTSPDVTKSEPYQASVRNNAENAKTLRKDRDPELQTKYDNIQFQIRNWELVLDEAEVNVVHLEKRLKAAREVLAEVEGFTDTDAVEDANRAKQILERLEPRLADERKRVETAKVMLKTWRTREREIPQQQLQQMRRETARRERLQF
jgi:hypothetical protein